MVDKYLNTSYYPINKMRLKNFEAGGFRTNLSTRIPEPTEIISGKEGKLYANRKDDRSLNFSMVAWDLKERLHLNKNQRILEVACGAGQLAHHLYKFTKNNHIFATDGSKELIKAAKERYNDEPIQFSVQNIHNHFGKGKFDVVVCKDSVHHFMNLTRGIKELLNLLKKNGILYIYDLTRDCLIDQVEARFNTFQDEHEKKRFLRSLNASLTLKEMVNITEKLGVLEWNFFYPIHFSETNLRHHQEWIKKDKTQEHKFFRLSRIYVIRKP